MAQPTFFFYDLETTGLSSRRDRIMQFAGQRTTLELEPVGEPMNLLIRLSADVLPSPQAIMVTGITPQQTLQDGLTEAEFLAYFQENIATPDTIFTGYNSVRFDDEFVRHLLYRNFYDPYEWQWQAGRSRWDLLDVVRMTRALRPDGIEWPTVNGKLSNRLEALTKANGLDHEHAHDALNDVLATIAVARLIHDKQPKLFQWLLQARGKNAVRDLVENGQPFVYASGKYNPAFCNTTVAVMVASHPKQQAALVYDLRFDPTEFMAMTPEELVDRWRYDPDATTPRLPVKTLQYNRCPAVAPLGVFDDTSQQRLQLSLEDIQKHRNLLKGNSDFANNLQQAIGLLDAQRDKTFAAADRQQPPSVDEQLYDGFMPDGDRLLFSTVHSSQPQQLTGETFHFKDQRLQKLLPLYKARNFPQSLTTEEQTAWEAHRQAQLFSGGQRSRLAQYFEELQKLAQSSDLTDNQRFLLEELQLYGQSIMPTDISE